MLHLNLMTRFRQVAFAAMFCLGAASVATAAPSEQEAGVHNSPVTNSLSGYIIAVG